MIYDVDLPFMTKGESTRRKKNYHTSFLGLFTISGDNLIERHTANSPTLGFTTDVFFPTDHLCDWLTKYTPSLVYIHEFNQTPRIGFLYNSRKGLVFGFAKPSDAVLFKLTWL